MNIMKRLITLLLLLACSASFSYAGLGSGGGSSPGRTAGRSAYTLPLLDSGQTKCYNNSEPIPCPSPGEPFYGQDASYSRNAPSYTDNGDRTVTDNVTGLMWQQEADNDIYNWYEATGSANIELNPGSVTDACGSLSLAGYSDWRLPTTMELMSIVDYGKSMPSIDTSYFHNVNKKWYWTSSTHASDSSLAYDIIFFRHGYVHYYDKSSESYVRCVRGGNFANQDTMAARFTDNGDTTVTDNYIGLIWQQGESSSMTWEPALTHCNGLNLAGYNDWRLPNVKELRSLLDSGKYNPALDTTYFPHVYSSLSYWTSTSDVHKPKRGWTANFGMGTVQYKEKSRTYYVRCVRGGQ